MNVYEITNCNCLVCHSSFTLYYTSPLEGLSTRLRKTGYWLSWANSESVIIVIKEGISLQFLPIDYYLQVPVLFTMMDLAFDYKVERVRW